MGASSGTCRFFYDRGEYGGQCRRYPPVPAFQVAFDGSGASHYEHMLPWVTAADWCGEYRTPTDEPASHETGRV